MNLIIKDWPVGKMFGFAFLEDGQKVLIHRNAIYPTPPIDQPMEKVVLTDVVIDWHGSKSGPRVKSCIWDRYNKKIIEATEYIVYNIGLSEDQNPILLSKHRAQGSHGRPRRTLGNTPTNVVLQYIAPIKWDVVRVLEDHDGFLSGLTVETSDNLEELLIHHGNLLVIDGEPRIWSRCSTAEPSDFDIGVWEEITLDFIQGIPE